MSSRADRVSHANSQIPIDEMQNLKFRNIPAFAEKMMANLGRIGYPKFYGWQRPEYRVVLADKMQEMIDKGDMIGLALCAFFAYENDLCNKKAKK